MKLSLTITLQILVFFFSLTVIREAYAQTKYSCKDTIHISVYKHNPVVVEPESFEFEVNNKSVKFKKGKHFFNEMKFEIVEWLGDEFWTAKKWRMSIDFHQGNFVALYSSAQFGGATFKTAKCTK